MNSQYLPTYGHYVSDVGSVQARVSFTSFFALNAAMPVLASILFFAATANPDPPGPVPVVAAIGRGLLLLLSCKPICCDSELSAASVIEVTPVLLSSVPSCTETS